MNLYKISQDVNNDYDTFDSAIVAAETEDEARNTHPEKNFPLGFDFNTYWCDQSQVTVEKIGTATKDTKAGVILASFNAG